MAKSTNQKLKLLYLMQIMLENTDDEHGLSMAEIIDKLAAYDISAERKSIYSDFELLRFYGIDIQREQRDRTVYYYVGARELELAELKLLVDAVQSSKFITEKKSRQLIKKLEQFVSKYDAQKLNRQVYVHGRIKTMNESIYYNVDIEFQYYQWNVDKEMELRHDGAFYQISPWGLVWDHENYYMVGYDSVAGILKHFRVDKMIRIGLLTEPRKGRAQFQKMDITAYTKKRFSMFDGEVQSVTMICENQFAGVILDRFGRDVRMRKEDDSHFRVTADVAVSNNFFGWLIGLGAGIKLIEPEEVVKQMQDRVCELYREYVEE